MNNFHGVLSNREAALMIWLLILLSLALLYKETRSSLWDIVKTLFQKKLLLVSILTLLYIGLELLLFWFFKRWDTSNIKETVFWISGTAFVLLFNIDRTSKEDDFFRMAVLRSLRLTAVVEFIVNFYSFSLWLELFLLPFLTFIVMIDAVAKVKEEYKSITRLTDNIMTLFGVAILLYITFRTIKDYRVFATLNNLWIFMLPFLLTLFFIPFLYFLAIYVTYENLFIRLNILLSRDPEICRFTKRKIFLAFHINLTRLKKFIIKNNLEFSNLAEEDDVLEMINRFKQRGEKQ